ncbi:MAG: cupin domain-containing protein [Stagnimonas sp.]|nr:cupin domain-containing protein [Stagnimonas sp.]
MTTVRRVSESDEYLTEERCRILELSNDPDDPALSIARARVAPGVRTRWHRLRGISERYLILEGEGLVEVGEEPPQRVVPGDVVLIAPMQRQRITNPGPGDLLFLALCTPRFVWDAYEDIEPTL